MAVEYGIQRRSVYLTPPLDPSDTNYWLEAFDEEEVWSMFGYTSSARSRMARMDEEGRIVRGIIRRIEDDRRIGFSMLFAPPDWLGLEQRFGTWEYAVVIRDRKDRDGFRAIQASDAMSHYAVDHLQLVDWWWRIRSDNLPSRAIAKRMGYRSIGVWTTGLHTFSFYRMTQATWDRRRARLERAETKNPSPGGACFVTLDGPPFSPIRE